MMFYGVEQSTDMRDRRTQIVKFTNISALKKWMKNSGSRTYRRNKNDNLATYLFATAGRLSHEKFVTAGK